MEGDEPDSDLLRRKILAEPTNEVVEVGENQLGVRLRFDRTGLPSRDSRFRHVRDVGDVDPTEAAYVV